MNGEEEEDEEVAVAVVVGKGDRSSSVKRNSAHDSMDVEGDGDGAGEDNDDDAGEEEDVMMVDEELMMRQRKRDEAHAALLESVKSANDVRSVAKLLHSKTFKDLLAKIEHFKTALRTIYHNTGPVEDDPEYKIILQANNVTMDIDNEILLVYKVGVPLPFGL